MTAFISGKLFEFFTGRFKKLEGLYHLALDQRGSSSACADELWSLVDPALWARMRNPWLILQRISEEKLTQLNSDKNFVFFLNKNIEMQKAELKSSGWFKENYEHSSLKEGRLFQHGIWA